MHIAARPDPAVKEKSRMSRARDSGGTAGESEIRPTVSFPGKGRFAERPW